MTEPKTDAAHRNTVEQMVRCPRCFPYLPGRILVGGMSYMPPRVETCPKCKGRGKISSAERTSIWPAMDNG